MDYTDMPQIAKNFFSYNESIRGKSEKTIHEYYYDLRTFFRYLKCSRALADFADFDSVDVSDVDIDLLRTVTIDDLYNYMFYVNKNRKNSARARARKVSSLKTFFQFLTVKQKLLSENPAKELESPKMPSSLPIYLTLEESRKLLSAVSGPFAVRDYAIITLFLNCGMRLSELVGINMNAIRYDTLKVVGKGNKERTIYLNDACLEALNNYLKLREKMTVKDPEALFISRNGTRISNRMVQIIVEKTLKKAELDGKHFSTHKLRHTAATLMYQYGDVDIRSLQEILGHKELSTTQIYTHINDEKLRSAIASNPLSGVSRKPEPDDEDDATDE